VDEFLVHFLEFFFPLFPPSSGGSCIFSCNVFRKKPIPRCRRFLFLDVPASVLMPCLLSFGQLPFTPHLFRGIACTKSIWRAVSSSAHLFSSFPVFFPYFFFSGQGWRYWSIPSPFFGDLGVFGLGVAFGVAGFLRSALRGFCFSACAEAVIARAARFCLYPFLPSVISFPQAVNRQRQDL